MTVPFKNHIGGGRDEDPVMAKRLDPGLCTSYHGRFLKVLNEYFRSF